MYDIVKRTSTGNEKILALLLSVLLQIIGYANSIESGINWFNVKLNDSKVGYYSVGNSTTLKRDVRTIVKTEKMYLLLKRMNNLLVVDSVMERRFDKDFKLLAFKTSVSEGNVKRKIHGQFNYEKKSLMLTTEINGECQSSKMDINKGALSELHVMRKIKKSGFKIGYSFSYIAFLPDICRYATCKIKIASREDIPVMGKKRELYRLEREVEGMGHRLSIWVDSALSPWLSELLWPKRTFRLERTTKEDAISLKRVYENRLDIFEEATLKLRVAENIDLPPDISIDQIKKVVFRIKNAPSFHMLQGGVQNIILHESDSSFLLEIYRDVSKMVKIPISKKEKFNLKHYLEPGDYIQSNNDKIKAIAAQLIDRKSRLNTVWKIKKWVFKHIKWCSDFGFLTAVSTLESGYGDCTEFSVLTAALCRSVDIPARLAMGYVVREKFSGEKILAPHMWVEVLIDFSWYPVDSTDDSQTVDPLRIRFLASAMNQDEIYRFFDLYSNFSTIDVELVSIIKYQNSENLDIQNKNLKKRR